MKLFHIYWLYTVCANCVLEEEAKRSNNFPEQLEIFQDILLILSFFMCFS